MYEAIKRVKMKVLIRADSYKNILELVEHIMRDWVLLKRI